MDLPGRSTEDVVRALDAILQTWQQINQRSIATGTTLLNLQSQAATAQQQQQQQQIQQQQPFLSLLLSQIHSEMEQSIRSIRQDLHEYSKVVSQLDTLARDGLSCVCAADSLMEMAGLTNGYVRALVKERRETYVKEYRRRLQLVAEMRERWVEMWVVDQMLDYQVEEEYLDRMRCLRLARQWAANQAALADLQKKKSVVL
ncbi:hypothetical protein H4R99_003937 [Coemansia sp. RSA 1722]|nr:hypothetical protein IWW45_004417 [Coemansia sp. RSA 485]KAJ2595005.1 hypothetical protein GGF39_003994 [Coemansia sp. RSA 1721]KAJ2598858.1 hypothetical protein H4R99_003937 [Coemansia sp. RSA 1722]